MSGFPLIYDTTIPAGLIHQTGKKGGKTSLLAAMQADSPLRLYVMDELGIGAQDKINYYDGFYTTPNQVTFGQTPLSPGGGTSVKFAATGGIVDLDARAALRQTTASLAYWMQFSSLAGISNTPALFSQGDNGGLLSGLWVDSTHLRFYARVSNAWQFGAINPTTQIGTTVHHILHVYDGSNLKVFLDGNTTPVVNVAAAGVLTYDNLHDDFINNYPAGPGNYANLFMSDVSYWAGVGLTGSDANALFNAANYPNTVKSYSPAPTAYWPLDESGTNGVYVDAQGSGNNGAYSATLIGRSSHQPAGGRYNQVMGTGGAMTYNNTGMNTVNGAWTQELFFIFFGNPSAQQFLMGSGSNNGTNNDAKIFLETSGKVTASRGPTSGAGTITSPSALATGVVHQVAAKWDGSTLSLIVDGVNVASSGLAAANLSWASPKVGSGGAPSNTLTPWAGGFAAIYNSAIADARLLAHWNAR